MAIGPVSNSPPLNNYIPSPNANTDTAQADPAAAASASAAATPAPVNPANAVLAISTPVQEAAESAVQTAQEAVKGDRQAQRLLAKREAKAHPAADNPNSAASIDPVRSAPVPVDKTSGSQVDTKA